MSRLAAIKEFAFMSVLYKHGFPVPRPVAQNRHAILMSLVPGSLLSSINQVAEPGLQLRMFVHNIVGKLYQEIMELIVRLADHGLVHCDYNEFNLLIDDNAHVTLIDFPQMVSTSHTNAQEYFDRDIQCIRTYFTRKLGFTSERYPTWEHDVHRKMDLDKEVAASGFTRADQATLERYTKEKTEEEKEEENDSSDDTDSDEAEEENPKEDETVSTDLSQMHFEPIASCPVATEMPIPANTTSTSTTMPAPIQEPPMENLASEQSTSTQPADSNPPLEEVQVDRKAVNKQTKKRLRQKNRSLHRNSSKGKPGAASVKYDDYF